MYMKMIIKNNADFNIKKILECGQAFRYEKFSDLHYKVFSLDKKAEVVAFEDKAVVESDDIDYFKKFFDLETDYGALVKKLEKFKELENIISYSRGIRILKQDLYEVIISFIISANNNIKRIQKILNKLCFLYGEDMGEYHAFPTLNKLKTLILADYEKLGAGYRAEYIFSTVQKLDEGFLSKLKTANTAEAKKMLLTLKGVGPKVADCILLFGLNKMDVFPVDTWIEKVYYQILNGEKINRIKISEKLVDIFKENSGLAQQYLFYYKRENS